MLAVELLRNRSRTRSAAMGKEAPRAGRWGSCNEQRRQKVVIGRLARRRGAEEGGSRAESVDLVKAAYPCFEVLGLFLGLGRQIEFCRCRSGSGCRGKWSGWSVDGCEMFSCAVAEPFSLSFMTRRSTV